jgi:hypothetical protein
LVFKAFLIPDAAGPVVATAFAATSAAAAPWDGHRGKEKQRELQYREPRRLSPVDFHRCQSLPLGGGGGGERALSLVTNLADGLGFWEKEVKAAHFADSKRAVLESLTLLEVMTSLKLMTTEEQRLLADELRDLARMISGLLRGAKRKEKKPAAEGEETAVVREGGIVYH